MQESKPQRQYKDRLFKAIFGRDTEESRRWSLDLYNALNGTDYSDPSALKVTTIENVIYMTMRNDVSFLIDDQMVLYEQQSTVNKNMPLRGFLYFAQLYNEYLSANKKDPNRSGKIELPTPKFIVFYNGPRDKPDEYTMKLSESFIHGDGSGAYEWTAFVKNINENHNKALQKKCKALYDYTRFVAKVRENSRKGLNESDAIGKALDEAIRENLLDGFFVRQKAEVIGMILTEFNEELFKQNVREDGYLEGLEDGKETKAVETAENFLREGLPPEMIARCIGLPLERVMQIAETIPAENIPAATLPASVSK